MDTSRREALKNLGKWGAAAVAAGASGRLLAAAGIQTPAQTEGPFYPVEDQADKDADMTRVSGHTSEALGERILIVGKLLDGATLKPISDAMVELWQACASGKYHHPEDPNEAPLDPDFQYWAQVRTNDNGEFQVKTIRPGAYQADPTWMRPPHIHVKVHKLGYPSLTTQMYFAGDSLNETDHILQKVPAKQRKLVIVDFSEGGDGISRGEWEIYLNRFSLSEGRSRGLIATPELD